MKKLKKKDKINLSQVIGGERKKDMRKTHSYDGFFDGVMGNESVTKDWTTKSR